MQIRTETQFGSQVVALLSEHLESMALLSPAESMHALSADELRQPDISFWCAWDNNTLMGCVALKDLGDGHAEIKSMRTASAYLRQGVAAALLEVLLEAAGRRGLRRLSLETGSAGSFVPAQRLYRRYGFEFCPPFADYIPDPHSVFMTLELPARTA